MLMIHVQQARRLFLAGDTIAIYPSNLRPKDSYGYEAWISLEDVENKLPPWKAWKEIRSYFRVRKCNSATGKYLAYYIKEI